MRENQISAERSIAERICDFLSDTERSMLDAHLHAYSRLSLQDLVALSSCRNEELAYTSISAHLRLSFADYDKFTELTFWAGELVERSRRALQDAAASISQVFHKAKLYFERLPDVRERIQLQGDVDRAITRHILDSIAIRESPRIEQLLDISKQAHAVHRFTVLCVEPLSPVRRRERAATSSSEEIREIGQKLQEDKVSQALWATRTHRHAEAAAILEELFSSVQKRHRAFDEAIACFKRALDIHTRDEFPYERDYIMKAIELVQRQLDSLHRGE
jgi:hypothetical protein